MRLRRSIPLLALLGLLALLAAAVAAAEGPTRDEYVDQLEAICRPDAKATQRAMKGARADMSAERLGVATGKFAKAAKIFSGTVKEISAVSRPAADTAKLSKWFTYLNRQANLLSEIPPELRADHAIKAQRLTSRFIHNGNQANNVVLAFGFDYCRFKFSRFG